MKRTLALLLCLLLPLPLAGCEPRLKRFEAQFLSLFDTVTTVVVYAHSEDEVRPYTQKLYDELKEYHQLYDIYNDYPGLNNLKTINDNAGVAPVKVDRRIIDLLTFAKDQYGKTYGKMNVALGAVLKIWHDYREAGINDPDGARLPALAALTAASAHTNIEDVVIDPAASTVYLKDPEMSLDVGSVAKGYAAERVAQDLEAAGLKYAMLSVGGNIRAIGAKDEAGTPFEAGVQDPDSREKVLLNVDLDGQSLVTSGDYERYYVVDGKRYHHLIDPETLFPTTYFRSVTILTRDSGLADALSTAVFNMPLDEGMRYVNGLPGVEALWVLPSGELRYSDHFRDSLHKDTK